MHNYACGAFIHSRTHLFWIIDDLRFSLAKLNWNVNGRELNAFDCIDSGQAVAFELWMRRLNEANCTQSTNLFFTSRLPCTQFRLAGTNACNYSIVRVRFLSLFCADICFCIEINRQMAIVSLCWYSHSFKRCKIRVKNENGWLINRIPNSKTFKQNK